MLIVVLIILGSMAGEALKYMVETSLSERDPIRVSNPTLLTKSIMITDGASQDYSRGTMTHYQEMAKVFLTLNYSVYIFSSKKCIRIFCYFSIY